MGKKTLESYKKNIYEVKKILRKKFITKNDAEYMKEKLEIELYMNDNKSSYEIEILYGKAELLADDAKKAIKHFEKAVYDFNYDEPKAAYYGMFKAYVELGDYKNALYNLALYDSCFSDNLNLIFYFKALYKVLELQGIEVRHEVGAISKEGYINCSPVSEKILNLYNDAEKYFDGGDYEKTYQKIKKCQALSILNDYSIDFKHLMKILEDISLLEKNSKEKYVADKIDESYKIKSFDEIKKILKEATSDPTNVYAIIELVKILIREGKYEEAYSCLNHKMDEKVKQEYIKELNELRKIVYEEYDLLKNKAKIERYLLQGDLFLERNDISKALKIYKEAYEELSSPVFLFKMAELYYSILDFKSAKKYFNKYLSIAEKYKVECYIYLDYIELIFDKESDSNKYSKFLSEVDAFDNFGDVSKKAEDVYYKYIKDEDKLLFKDKDEEFNNRYKEIISSIRKGDVFRIERINSDKIMPEDLVLIKIGAAPILLKKGATYLADLYYESALKFSDNDDIKELAHQYKKIRENLNQVN